MDGKKQGLRICCLTMALLTALLFGKASNVGAWATITVNSLADPGNPDVCSLRDAIIAANTMTATNGCAAGNGHDTIQFSVTGTIMLTDTLPEITDGQLTIKGPLSPAITIDGGSAVRVIHVASGSTVNLKNMTIAHGNTLSEQLPTRDGGAILNEGTLTITNCTVTHSGAFGDGGAIANEGMLVITYSKVFGNSAFGDAGGILNGVSPSYVLPPGGSTLTITNSTVSHNSATNGGGISSGGPLTITNSTVSDNFVSARPGLSADGGGILSGGPLTITNSTVAGNFASSTGQSLGGGIANDLGTMTITNSTVTGNSAIGGGGGISNSGTLTITNSTLSGNSCLGGCGIFNSGFVPGVASLKNTIVAGSTNIDVGGPASNCSGTIGDAGYNICDDATCGFAKTGSANNGDGINPMLSPAGLADNGGPTQTIALVAGSPAIDAIPVADCIDQASPPNPLTTDQRGFPRPDAGEGVCDIGAYEFQDFAGDPGSMGCYAVSLSALSHQYRTLSAAASTMGFRNVKVLQTAIRAFCNS